MIFTVVFIISVLATQAVNGQNWQQQHQQPQQQQQQHQQQQQQQQQQPQQQQQNVNNQYFANFTPVQQEQDNSISSRFNFFDMEILELFNDNENYFISPASLKITLAMLLEGSKGKCAQEISKILRIPVDVNASRATLNSLLNNLSTKSGTTVLNSANLVAVSNKFTIIPEYRDILQQHYKARIASLDFKNAANSASSINGWVNQETEGLIPEIIRADSFQDEVSLIIANALFFKAQWKTEFERKRTKLEDFQTSTDRYKVETMRINGPFRYRFIADLDAQALELPYSDGEYAMLILLPSERQSVDGLQKDLLHTNFISIIDSLESTDMQISLPKFDIEYSTNLVPTLEKMGIKEIFSENANLTGIIQQAEVKISKIFHKAKVEVNEKGTTAAAVTGAVVIPLMGSSSESFIANRPFLFFIYSMYTKNVLFEGRLNRPLAAYDTVLGTARPNQVTNPPVPTVVPIHKQKGNSNPINSGAPLPILFNTETSSSSQIKGPHTTVVTSHLSTYHQSSFQG